MRNVAPILTVVTLLAFAAGPALACRWPVYHADHVSFPRDDFAALMVENAAYIDLVIAERAAPIPELERWVDATVAARAVGREPGFSSARAKRSMLADLRKDGAARITFRSLEKLKGDGPAWFQLDGFWSPRLDERYQRRDLADLLSPATIFSTLAGPIELGEGRVGRLCTGYLSVKPGARYLIFRDADGRLLGATIPASFVRNGEITLRFGHVIRPVLTDDDPWLEAIRDTAARR